MLILLVGGNGRSLPEYRRAAAEAGHDLQHHEQSLPRATPALGAVLLCVRTCSHPQKEAAENVARGARAPLIRLTTASVSSLRRALAALGGAR